MKKFLSLVLALVMTMSLVTVSAGASFKDDDKINYTEAVEVMKAIKVVDGYADGKFNPTNVLTRQAAAKIICNLILGPTTADALVATSAPYPDVPASSQFAGYIAYCKQTGIISGYADGNFQPTGTLTGYAFMKMLLGALGYDQTIEGYVGENWKVNVAKRALALGLDDGLIDAFNGNKSVNREEACLYATNMLTCAMVEYGRLGVATVKATNKTFMETYFANALRETPAKDRHENDPWGRPSTSNFQYKTSKGTWKAVIYVPQESVADYNVATSYCDICDELGEKKEAKIEAVYTNGVEGKHTALKATDTKSKIGAQGQIVEIYDMTQDGDKDNTYRLVIIDTYLAEVKDVVAEKTDKNGHVTRDAYLKLTVYTTAGGETMYVAGNDYEKGDYVLVNVNENEDEQVEIIGLGDKALVEIVSAAESFDGAQSKIWYNASKRTIDDADYMAACQFNHDEAGTSKDKFTWFLDQFGNVIGSFEIETKYSYAVLKDLIWVVGRPGHAEATLVYMNGEEDTVPVVSIDGWNGTYGPHDVEPELSDKNGKIEIGNFGMVSSDSKYNDLYNGFSLYRVHTNSDDEVILDLVDGNDTLVYFAGWADFSKNKVYFDNSYFYISDETEFLVRETNDDDEIVYTPYTRDELPEYATGSIFAAYTVDDDGYITRMYIKNAADAADFADHLFVTTDSYHRVAGTDTYKMDVVVDGEEKTIRTTEAIAKKLADNKDKLFHVDFETDPLNGIYGFVTDAMLVNEATDDCYNETWCEYATTPALKGNTLTDLYSGYAYKLTADTKYIGVDGVAGLEDAIDEGDKGIWVVATDDNNWDVAICVYVGKKLSTSTDITVSGTAATVANAVKGADGVWTVTSVKDADKMTITVEGANDNTVLVNKSHDDETALGTLVMKDVPSVFPGPAVVKVYAEDGVHTAEHEITLVWVASDTNNALAKVTVDGTSVTLAEGNAAAASATPVELTQEDSFTLVATAASGKATVKVGSGTTVALAAANLQNTNTVTVTGTTGLNGGYVVIQITAESGAVMYYVYQC